MVNDMDELELQELRWKITGIEAWMEQFQDCYPPIAVDDQRELRLLQHRVHILEVAMKDAFVVLSKCAEAIQTLVRSVEE